MERPNTETLLGNKGRVNSEEQEKHKEIEKRWADTERMQTDKQTEAIKMIKTVDKNSTRNVRKEKSKLKLFICVRKDSKY